MLDHDLAQRARTDDDLELSGTDVALVLMEHFCLDIPILVHSTNPIQASRVVRQLERKGFSVTHIPYYDLTERAFTDWMEEARGLWVAIKGGSP